MHAKIRQLFGGRMSATWCAGTLIHMEFPQHIELRPDVMMGKPCMKGTRIPVYVILEKLGGGESVEQFLAAYPQLTRDHVTAALQAPLE